MSYCGFFMALPQFAIGALNPGSDVGMAMGYFGLSADARLLLGVTALAAIPPAALTFLRDVLALAPDPACIASPAARSRFVWRIATLPALCGAVICIAFRVPREWLEVVIVPAWVAAFGLAWMQGGAWRASPHTAARSAAGSVRWPMLAVFALLLVFQLILRPGIAFYR